MGPISKTESKIRKLILEAQAGSLCQKWQIVMYVQDRLPRAGQAKIQRSIWALAELQQLHFDDEWNIIPGPGSRGGEDKQ